MPGVPQRLRTAVAGGVPRELYLAAGFLDVLGAEYGSELRLVDFRTRAEPARQAINIWAAEQTRDRIPNLLAPGAINEATRLLLVNALYFEGSWSSPFVRAMTAASPFTTLDGATVTVQMMRIRGCLPGRRLPLRRQAAEDDPRAPRRRPVCCRSGFPHE